MLIERCSILSLKTSSMELPVTEEQLAAWRAGALAQEAMPNLTDAEREFVMTGITPGEWAAAFGSAQSEAEAGIETRTAPVPDAALPQTYSPSL